MNDYLSPFYAACTLIAISYAAFKIRTRIESAERWAVPLLTGIASILMMLSPRPEWMEVDLRFAPVVMAGLRYGWSAALLSTLPPAAFGVWMYGPEWLPLLQELLLPAVLSSLCHRREREAGSVLIRLADGLWISSGLFLCRIAAGLLYDRPSSWAEWGADQAIAFAASALALLVLIMMYNDDRRVWLAQRRLELLANQDGLTRLPNLRSFFEIAKNTLKRQRIAILMLDIDNFKNYNDRLGHPEGDQLLREVGQVLRSVIGEQDYVARYGGEEFIMMCQLDGPEALTDIGERLLNEIRTFPFRNREVQPGQRITLSIGIAAARHVNEDLAKLIAQADEALYLSKHDGKDRFTVYGKTHAERPLEA